MNEHEFCDDMYCQECCEHIEHDHGICLYCDKDITNNLIALIDFND